MLVMTNTVETPISDKDFAKRLTALQQLQVEAHDTYSTAVAAILTLAVAYAALHESVARDAERVSRLNDVLGLDRATSTRFRTIAGQIHRLRTIQGVLPPALESIYEVARRLKQNDERSVRTAIENGRLSPISTLRDVRRIQVPVIRAVHLGRTTDRIGQRDHKNEPTDIEEFIRLLKSIAPEDSRVLVDVEVDDQSYGTTITGRFTITNILRAKDGTLPATIPPDIAEAVRSWARRSDDVCPEPHRQVNR